MVVPDLSKAFPLISHKYKLAGYILFPAGLILLIIRFYFDYKSPLLDIKTLAIYSTYLQTKYFTIIDNHITEELGGMFIVTGLILLVCSKEKDESDSFNYLRLRALLFSHLYFLIFIEVILIFVFGIAFVKAAILGLILPSILYLLLFRLYLYRYRRSLKER